jgi:hypothetical protein
VLQVLLLSSFSVTAFPNGAGSCPPDKAAVGGIHLEASSVTTGSLRDNRLIIEINGRELSTNSTLTLKSGVDHNWILVSNSGAGFRGFLIRLDARTRGVDTTVALSSANGNVQEAFTACIEVEGVGGLTHTDNALKTSVVGTLRLDEEASDLQLDVTVVMENRNGNSVYYYSAYQLNINDSGTPPPAATEAPTTPPPLTPEPTTSVPTTVSPATKAPTVAPFTAVPTAAPGTPTAAPSTISPTTQEPTSTNPPEPTTFAPTLTPTETFTDSPTAAPSAKPTDAVTPEPSTVKPTSSRTNRPTREDPSLEEAFLLEADGKQQSPPPLEPAPNESSQREDDGSSGSNNNSINPSVMEVEECSPENPCSLCQGDCNEHDDCAGELECFRRPGESDAAIPGCEGIGLPGTDYCYQPHSLILRLRTPFCSPNNPCAVCEGVSSIHCAKREFLM